MHTERKKRGSKKNKLEEIQKPRGYERELPLDEIVGVTDHHGDLLFLIKWLNCDEYDLLPATEVKEKSPQDVIAYYENRSSIVKRAKERERICGKFSLENLYVPEEPPAKKMKISEDDDEVAVEVPKSQESIAEEKSDEISTADETPNQTVPADNEPSDVSMNEPTAEEPVPEPTNAVTADAPDETVEE